MSEFRLTQQQARAALSGVHPEKTRYAMENARVYRDDSPGVVLEATDGKTLIRVRSHEDSSDVPKGGVLLPPNLLKHAAQQKGGADVFTDGKTAQAAGLTVPVPEGHYPPTDDVWFDSRKGGTEIGLSVTVLERLCKAAKGAGVDALRFNVLDRTSAVRIKARAPEVQFDAIVMPLNLQD